ncbi:MAG: helix-turn-helix transcriptional regulator [Hyphomicrobiaceae bacterium]
MKQLPKGTIDWRRVRELTGYPGSEDLARDARDKFFVRPISPPGNGEKHYHRLYRLKDVERWVAKHGRYTRERRARMLAGIGPDVPLVSLKDAAKLLRLKVHNLRRIAKSKSFPRPICRHRPGATSYWRLADVMRWQSEQRRQRPPPT